MKILILINYDIKNSELTIEKISTLYLIYAYVIIKYLKKIPDIEIIIDNCYNPSKKNFVNIEYPTADHAFVIDNRGLYYRDINFYNVLRPKISGAICTMCANSKYIENEDILFYLLPYGKKNKKKCKYIGWAADHELCVPNKYKDKIQIFIDHSYYGKCVKMNKKDKSLEIINDVCNFATEFKKNQHKYNVFGKDVFDKENPIVIKRFISGSIETVDINNPYYEKYNTVGVPYSEAVKEYGKSDIFIVTHPECLGVSVIENSLAGALPVIPKGYIKKELLYDLECVVYSGNNIPWDEVFTKLNPEKIRNKALKHTWEKNTIKIYETLSNYNTSIDKYKNDYIS